MLRGRRRVIFATQQPLHREYNHWKYLWWVAFLACVGLLVTFAVLALTTPANVTKFYQHSSPLSREARPRLAKQQCQVSTEFFDPNLGLCAPKIPLNLGLNHAVASAPNLSQTSITRNSRILYTIHGRLAIKLNYETRELGPCSLANCGSYFVYEIRVV